jgi:hypothetical protein
MANLRGFLERGSYFPAGGERVGLFAILIL